MQEFNLFCVKKKKSHPPEIQFHMQPRKAIISVDKYCLPFSTLVSVHWKAVLGQLKASVSRVKSQMTKIGCLHIFSKWNF